MKITRKEGLKKVRVEHNRFLFWLIIILMLVLIIILVNLGGINKSLENNTRKNLINDSIDNSQLANPASVYCTSNNGTLQIRNDENGSQYGVCVKYGMECDEWKYFRGECNFTFDRYCQSDSDCVPEQCCHATSCINKQNKSVCEGIACTLDCKSDTLDCGQGSCGCVKNRCIAIFDNLNSRKTI